jgi:hypothetical protein
VKRKRKRAPGGGRKPNPNKKVMFSTRLEPQVLAQLKAAAADWPGGNVSAFTEFLINRALRERDEEKRDPALKALLYFIAQLAEHISGAAYLAPNEGRSEFLAAWRTDLFRFRAFKLAVRKLLDALEEPPGQEIKPKEGKLSFSTIITLPDDYLTLKKQLSPEDFGSMLDRLFEEGMTPENFATSAFDSFWRQANKIAPRLPREVEQAVFAYNKALEREFYALPKALRDLKLKSKTDKPEGNDND